MRAMIKQRAMLLNYFAALALTCAALTVAAPQASAQAAAQMPKQYTPPAGEPVPQSSTLARRAARADSPRRLDEAARRPPRIHHH